MTFIYCYNVVFKKKLLAANRLDFFASLLRILYKINHIFITFVTCVRKLLQIYKLNFFIRRFLLITNGMSIIFIACQRQYVPRVAFQFILPYSLFFLFLFKIN